MQPVPTGSARTTDERRNRNAAEINPATITIIRPGRPVKMSRRLIKASLWLPRLRVGLVKANLWLPRLRVGLIKASLWLPRLRVGLVKSVWEKQFQRRDHGRRREKAARARFHSSGPPGLRTGLSQPSVGYGVQPGRPGPQGIPGPVMQLPNWARSFALMKSSAT